MHATLYATECAWCGLPMLVRSTQRFCGASCRVMNNQRKAKHTVKALVMLAGRYGFTEGQAVELISAKRLDAVSALLETAFGLTYVDGKSGHWETRS